MRQADRQLARVRAVAEGLEDEAIVARLVTSPPDPRSSARTRVTKSSISKPGMFIAAL